MPSGMSDEEFQRRMTAYLAGTREKIKKHGLIIQAVFDTKGLRSQVPFAYTVGLAAHGLPELIVSGLPDLTAHGILDPLGRAMIAKEKTPVAGELRDDLLHNYPMYVLDATEQAQDEVGVARQIHGGPVSVLQLVWPDKTLLWPWEDEYLGGAQRVWGSPDA